MVNFSWPRDPATIDELFTFAGSPPAAPMPFSSGQNAREPASSDAPSKRLARLFEVARQDQLRPISDFAKDQSRLPAETTPAKMPAMRSTSLPVAPSPSTAPQTKFQRPFPERAETAEGNAAERLKGVLNQQTAGASQDLPVMMSGGKQFPLNRVQRALAEAQANGDGRAVAYFTQRIDEATTGRRWTLPRAKQALDKAMAAGDRQGAEYYQRAIDNSLKLRESNTDSADASRAEVNPVWDTIRSGASGLRSGVETLIGLPGDIGYGMRYGAEQLGRLVGSPVDQDYIDRAGKHAALRNPLDFGSADVKAATESVIGPGYQPQTTAGEYAHTIGEFLPGSVMGPGSLGRNALLFGLVPGAASETAGQLTKGKSYETSARLAAALAGGFGSSLALGKPALSVADQSRKAVAEAAERQGVRLPAAANAGKEPRLTGAMKEIPLAGDPLAKSARTATEQLAERFDELTASRGRASKPLAAQGAREGLLTWTAETSRDLVSAAYDKVDSLVNPSVTTPLTATQAMTRTISDELASSGGRGGRAALDYLEEAVSRPQGLTYEGLKRLRTEIGQLRDDALIPNPMKAAYKRLYGSLTEDLEASVKNAGGDSALQAWRSANRTANEIAKKRDELTRVIGKQGAASAESVFAQIESLAMDSARGNLERLKEVRSVLSTKAWNDVRATLLKRIGRDPSSPTNQFSPARFLTSYGKLSEGGKTLLFGKAKTDLDDLALISERHRALEKLGNPSGSGRLASVAGMAGMFTYAPLQTVSLIVGGNVLARMLARPTSARSIARWARARQNLRRGVAPAVVDAYMAAMKDLASDLEQETGRPARELVKALSAPQAGGEPGDLQ